MQLQFDTDGLLREIAAIQAHTTDIHLSSSGKSSMRFMGAMRECKSPSRYALGHLIDTVAGPGAADRLLDAWARGGAGVETYPLGPHLCSVCPLTKGHFAVVIRLVRPAVDDKQHTAETAAT